MKICSKCQKSKPTNSFSKRKLSKDGLNHWCKSCVATNNKKWTKANIESVRAKSREYDRKNRTKRRHSELKHKFGIGLSEYSKLLEEQNNSCAICSVHKDDLNKNLAVDHCHSTNKVRGLLCGPCNRAIGIFKDDPELCRKASQYLIESARKELIEGSR